MSVFYPGSTPIHTFTLPFAASDCLTARVSYRQESKTIITKTVDTFGGNGGGSCVISVSFTQAESMRFQDAKDISAQVNLITTDNMRHTSKPIQISAGTQYDRKVIPDE